MELGNVLDAYGASTKVSSDSLKAKVILMHEICIRLVIDRIIIFFIT